MNVLYRLASWYVRFYSNLKRSRSVTVRQYPDGNMGQYRVINAWPGDDMEVYGEFRVNGIFYDITTWTNVTSTRFSPFRSDELSELIIALDHRRAEAVEGNAYVWTDVVESLLKEALLGVTDAPDVTGS